MTREYYKNHMWGDKDFDWEGLDEAMNFMQDLAFYSAGLDLRVKEKFGQARVHPYWWDGTFTSLCTKTPNKIYFYELKYLSRINYFLFSGIILKRQIKAYVRAYEEAVMRWPHLMLEILGSPTDPEYLRDLYISLGLESPWLKESCSQGQHVKSKHDEYCLDCFKCLTEYTDNQEDGLI